MSGLRLYCSLKFREQIDRLNEGLYTAQWPEECAKELFSNLTDARIPVKFRKTTSFKL